MRRSTSPLTRLEAAALAFTAGALAATCCCLAAIAHETHHQRKAHR